MPLDIPRIHGLCFDVDGTLSDTDDQFVIRLARWLHPGRFIFRQRDPRPFARRIVMAIESPGTFVYGLPDRLGIDHRLAGLGDFVYWLGLGKSLHPFLIIDGIHAMLARLADHYPLAVVSARGERSTLAFLKQFDLLPFFQCIATAQTCRYTKPYPDPILWAAGQMGVSPANCLMVGDTSVDILAGKAAGAQTAGVLCGFGQEAELRRMGADLILASTPHIVDVLLGSEPAG